MKQLLKLAFVLLLLTSCVNEYERLQDCQKKFPGKTVMPAPPTALATRGGGAHTYDYLVIDSSGEMLGVDYYAFSKTKIYKMESLLFTLKK